MYQVTNTPLALPGSCIFCPGSVRERYIDTGMQLEFHGAVYICDQCIFEMGRMLGMITEDQVERLSGEVAEKYSEIFSLRTKVAGLEEALHGLGLAGFQSVPERGDPPVLLPDASGQGDVVGESDDGSPGGEGGLGAGEGTPAEQVHDEGVGELRPDDGADGDHFRLKL